MTKYIVNGKTVSKEEFGKGGKSDWLDGAPMTSNTYTDHDPLVSEGLGCMKSQVQETRDIIKHHNIKGVKVRNNGQLEITSRRGRKEFMKVRGLADSDGGYGDG
jgi:hypothetical protein